MYGERDICTIATFFLTDFNVWKLIINSGISLQKELAEKTCLSVQAGTHQCPHSKPAPDNSTVDTSKVARRARQSPYPMITVKQAQEIVLGHCGSLGTEMIALDDALGRVLSVDALAKDPLPPFPASIKDG